MHGGAAVRARMCERAFPCLCRPCSRRTGADTSEAGGKIGNERREKVKVSGVLQQKKEVQVPQRRGETETVSLLLIMARS